MAKTATHPASVAARKQSQIEKIAKIGLDREIVSLAKSAAKEDGVSLGAWILRECSRVAVH